MPPSISAYHWAVGLTARADRCKVESRCSGAPPLANFSFNLDQIFVLRYSSSLRIPPLLLSCHLWPHFLHPSVFQLLCSFYFCTCSAEKTNKIISTIFGYNLSLCTTTLNMTSSPQIVHTSSHEPGAPRTKRCRLQIPPFPPCRIPSHFLLAFLVGRRAPHVLRLMALHLWFGSGSSIGGDEPCTVVAHGCTRGLVH